MKLILINPRGFCAGVVRAINTVEAALKRWGAPIYVKHEIVHNAHVVEDLKKRGVVFIEDFDEVPNNSHIIFSAHGVSPQIRRQAQAKNLFTIDATCGLVTKIHSAVTYFAKKGFHILLVGHKKHVEIQGTYAEAPDQITIIEKLEDIKILNFTKKDRLAYLTQTTLSIDDVKNIVIELKKRYPNIKTLGSSSICYATTNRQQALAKACEQADIVLVAGDKKSSNSNRLREIAKTRGVCSYLIHDETKIDEKWLENKSVLALTAGASTPEYVVKRCVQKLKFLGVDEIDNFEYLNPNFLNSLRNR